VSGKSLERLIQLRIRREGADASSRSRRAAGRGRAQRPRPEFHFGPAQYIAHFGAGFLPSPSPWSMSAWLSLVCRPLGVIKWPVSMSPEGPGSEHEGYGWEIRGIAPVVRCSATCSDSTTITCIGSPTPGIRLAFGTRRGEVALT